MTWISPIIACRVILHSSKKKLWRSSALWRKRGSAAASHCSRSYSPRSSHFSTTRSGKDYPPQMASSISTTQQSFTDCGVRCSLSFAFPLGAMNTQSSKCWFHPETVYFLSRNCVYLNILWIDRVCVQCPINVNFSNPSDSVMLDWNAFWCSITFIQNTKSVRYLIKCC